MNDSVRYVRVEQLVVCRVGAITITIWIPSVSAHGRLEITVQKTGVARSLHREIISTYMCTMYIYTQTIYYHKNGGLAFTRRWVLRRDTQ